MAKFFPSQLPRTFHLLLNMRWNPCWIDVCCKIGQYKHNRIPKLRIIYQLLLSVGADKRTGTHLHFFQTRIDRTEILIIVSSEFFCESTDKCPHGQNTHSGLLHLPVFPIFTISCRFNGSRIYQVTPQSSIGLRRHDYVASAVVSDCQRLSAVVSGCQRLSALFSIFCCNL